jgi:O-antigen/teichoic acid export membrane protein
MASNFTILLTGLVSSVLLARFLGTDGRGEFAAATLWGTLLATLASLGTAEAILYFGAQSEHTPGDVYFAGLVMVLLFSIPAVVLGYFLMPLLLSAQRAETIELARIFLVFIPFGMLSGNSGNLVRSQLRIYSYNLLVLIIPLGMTIGICGLAVLDALTVEMAVLLQLGISIMTAAIAIFTVLHYQLLSSFSIKPKLFRMMFWYGARVQIGTLSSAANLRLDQVLLAGLVNPAMLGMYVVAVKVSSISSALVPIVMTVAVPQIASKAGKTTKTHEFLQIFQTYWSLSLIFKVSFIIALPLIVPLIYGVEFGGTVPISMLLVFASLFYDARAIMAGGAQAMNDPWLASRAELIASILTIILLVILLPPFGILGAALASVGAYITSFLVTVRGLSIHHGIAFSELFAIKKAIRQIQRQLQFKR